MPNVFIYGSCVSRDTVTVLGSEWKIVEYVARQGHISAATGATKVRGTSLLSSAFQNRCVQGDIDGSLPEVFLAAKNDIDVILIDLVDERLGVYEMPDGGYLTHSWELGESRLIEQQETKPRFIEFGSDEHYELWLKSSKVIVEKLKSAGVPVILLAPAWAEHSDTGAPLSYRNSSVSKYNDSYSRYVDSLSAVVDHTIRTERDETQASTSHTWGLAPYHYVQPVYQKLCEGIRRAMESSPGTLLE